MDRQENEIPHFMLTHLNYCYLRTGENKICAYDMAKWVVPSSESD